MPVDRDEFIRQTTERMRSLVQSGPSARDDAEDLLLTALQCEGGYDEVLALFETIRYG